MLKTLGEHGVTLPEMDAARQPAAPVGEGEVLCSRCGLVKPKMARPPFSHASGINIQNNVCADCWREWIAMGTKVINELRLPLNDPQAQKVFDTHMHEFFAFEVIDARGRGTLTPRDTTRTLEAAASRSSAPIVFGPDFGPDARTCREREKTRR